MLPGNNRCYFFFNKINYLIQPWLIKYFPTKSSNCPLEVQHDGKKGYRKKVLKAFHFTVWCSNTVIKSGKDNRKKLFASLI